MLLENIVRKSFGTVCSIILLVSIGARVADCSEMPQSKQHSCKPKLVRKEQPVWPKLLPGSVLRRNPVISYDITESGALENVRLLRGSGIPKIDEAFVTATKRWRYAAAPGCGVRKGSYTSLVHVQTDGSLQSKEK